MKWLLLTTLPLAAPANAVQGLRWRIEDWHGVGKSGCRIETLASQTADRLRRAIAIHLVMAWCILLPTLLGLETQALPAQMRFADLELKVVQADAKENG